MRFPSSNKEEGAQEYICTRIEEMCIENIMNGNLSSAFLLLIDNHILENIRICSELEALKAKFQPFHAILHARGAYGGNTLRLQHLGNKMWVPSFFYSTMSRRNLTEIPRYIRSDKRNQRSQSYR